MIINISCFKDQELYNEILSSSNKIFITTKDDSHIYIEEEKIEKGEKELAKIKKEGKIYIFENTSNLLSINNQKPQLAQIETYDVAQYLNFKIYFKIYQINIKKAYIEEEHEGRKKKHNLSRFLTFIGNPYTSHIPAYPKNPLIPISDYAAAIIIREDFYELIPINSQIVRYKMKELKISIRLEKGMSFEIGNSRFIFDIEN
ncbi:MAG: hypothetical protein N2446_02580 [Elusimicrobiales bacterium]|nr:hypothetical protein [Elusimicrobiales bacterium]